MAEIFSPRDKILTDVEILSFWEMMFSPDQTRWDYEDNTAFAQKTDAEILDLYRTKIMPRTTTIAYWARAAVLIVRGDSAAGWSSSGMDGIDIKQVSVSLTGDSFLKTAMTGEAGSGSGDADILTKLGNSGERAAALPMTIKGKALALLYVDGHLTNGLTTVEQVSDVVLAGNSANASGRIDESTVGWDPGDGDELDALVNHLTKCIEIDGGIGDNDPRNKIGQHTRQILWVLKGEDRHQATIREGHICSVRPKVDEYRVVFGACWRFGNCTAMIGSGRLVRFGNVRLLG